MNARPDRGREREDMGMFSFTGALLSNLISLRAKRLSENDSTSFVDVPTGDYDSRKQTPMITFPFMN
jgi:hypothetical protein